MNETHTTNITPIILSGGAGTRLWPLSRRQFPKQLLPLTGDQTMIQNTALRVAPEHGFDAPIVVCNEDHRFVIAEQMREVAIAPRAIVLEPHARNTAPAIAAAACLLPRDTIMVALASDHLIDATQDFRASVAQAVKAARDGWLVALGVPPTRPETGYGYIEEGDQILADGVLNIRRFHEKPDADRAKTYVESGLHLWNASIFVFKAGAYLDELALLAPAVLGAATASVDTAMRDLDFVRLDAESFAAAPSISIDFAVMEKTKRAAVARLASDWSDVGSWEEMWRHSEHDEHGNARVGDVITVDTSGSYIRSDGRLVATLGLTDHVVVATKDSVMVAPRTRAQDIKLLAEKVAAAGRSEHDSHVRVYRPWGYYEGIDAAPGFQVKRIMVKPGERLSLQKHAHRSEHWIIVSGRARVTIDERIFELEANQSTYVPVGSIHRLENCEAEPLLMVEVQCGDYLGEDDIIRLEDNYHRS